MGKRMIAELKEAEVKYSEILTNKIKCARQAVSPAAIPPYAPPAAAEKFFREAIFVLADAQYLEDELWRSLAQQYNISLDDRKKMYLDFGTQTLFLED
jgi:hypothetical protein